MSGRPKRHHYLPEFYLHNFCRDGLLWVFDRERKQFRPQTPKNTAIESHYYSIEDEEGNKHTEVEEFLSKVETWGKYGLDRLVGRSTLSPQEKEELSIFVAFMMNRVPDFEKSMNVMHEGLAKQFLDFALAHEEGAQSIIDRWQQETGQKSTVTAQQLMEFQKRGEYRIKVSKAKILEMMLTMSMQIANYFRQMDWLIVHAPPETSFITTDNPVIIVAPRREKDTFFGVGIITKGAEKVFPLSQSACLIMGDHGDKMLHADIDRQKVRGINLTMTSASDQLVVARDEALLRNLVGKTRLTEWNREGRIRVS